MQLIAGAQNRQEHKKSKARSCPKPLTSIEFSFADHAMFRHSSPDQISCINISWVIWRHDDPRKHLILGIDVVSDARQVPAVVLFIFQILNRKLFHTTNQFRLLIQRTSTISSISQLATRLPAQSNLMKRGKLEVTKGVHLYLASPTEIEFSNSQASQGLEKTIVQKILDILSGKVHCMYLLKHTYSESQGFLRASYVSVGIVCRAVFYSVYTVHHYPRYISPFLALVEKGTRQFSQQEFYI